MNLGVVAAIRAVGVRGDPCGAMRWTVYGWSQVGCSVECEKLRVLAFIKY